MTDKNMYCKIKQASIIGIIGNIFLMIIKGIVGVLSNSKAMLADCLNSGGDIFSSIMTYIGTKISSKPKDEDHNLGHGKAEYIYSLIISIVLIITSLFILKDSIISLFQQKKFIFSVWLVIVCIITIIIKFSLFLYTNLLAKKYDNLLIKVNSKDHLYDSFITLINLISCLLSLVNIYFVDGFVGIFISFWMISSAIKTFKECYDVLMDKAMNNDTKEKVYEIIKQHSEIKKVIHFNSTPIGYRYQISLTIFVDGKMSTFDSHEIANNLEKEIIKKVDEVYLAVIHVNPI